MDHPEAPAPAARRLPALLAAALLVSFVGDEFAALASSFALASSPLRAVGVATLLAAQAVPRVVLGRRFGAVVDRFGPRRVLGLVLPAEGVVCALLAASYRSTPALLGLVVVLAGLGALAAPAVFVTVRHLAPDETRLLRYNAMLEALVGVSLLAGPVAGGFVAERFGFAVAYLVDGLSFALAGAIVVARLEYEVGAPHGRPTGAPGPRLRLGGRLFTTPALALVLPVALVAMGVSSATNVGFVFWVRREVGADATVAYGLLIAAWSLGSLIGALTLDRFSIRRPWSPGRLALIGAVGIGLGEALAGLRPPLALLGAGWLVGGLANAVHNVAVRQLIHTSVDRASLGTAFGEYSALSSIALLAGYGLGAATGAEHSVGLFLVGGLASASVALAGLIVLTSFSSRLPAEEGAS